MIKAQGVDATTFTNDIAVANELATHEAFYMPHSLDFRGRTYAVPYFNHQRSDHMKALFRFADGVALGPDGGRWLKIHLANCGDFGKMSKKPFDAREAWVDENHDKIIATVMDPEAMVDWWTEADSPFCFLQACFEYTEWYESGFDPEFVSTIAGAADGSCSGLQHYSAITRSEEEAFHVNLLPRPDVGDIYQVTADQAVPTLQAAAAQGDVTSQIILDNGFGRSEVKRNVMTYFYGSARFGMRDQHMADLMRPLGDKVAMGELAAHLYLVISEGVKVVYLDNMTALVDETNERASVEGIIKRMALLCQELGIIIMLLCHLATPDGKPHEEGGQVSLRHFKGSRAMGAFPHYSFGLERNTQHEVPEYRNYSILRCVKDRYTGRYNGATLTLHYDVGSGQLVERDLPEDYYGDREEGGGGYKRGSIPPWETDDAAPLEL
ncbi:hypothetical protein V474_00575 [Novosphingobium barchaimii LL02]|uniref:DNA-directed RNA polymerase n=1 Tax=Novosphingobium barchaimii LL02 TaxID=1114963 RepID=A0A0J7Y941_9SPHN|nr:DNA-directed RNA polymerase [Novosphingobium barchaimii]KMS60444.1 hypothetical protein V474_00575 [Novosphingobium barchaimii LL02]